jgi:hypothetical protein
VIEVCCLRCGDGYTRHEQGGGPCRARDGGRCPCLGFRWVAPEPDGVSYQRRSTPSQ